MRLELVNPTPPIMITCSDCGDRYLLGSGRRAWADLDGPAFKTYYCESCVGKRAFGTVERRERGGGEVVRFRDVEFDDASRLVLGSGKEVRPLELHARRVGSEWTVPCAFGFEGGDGSEEEREVSLGDVVMIRGAYFEGDGR